MKTIERIPSVNMINIFIRDKFNYIQLFIKNWNAHSVRPIFYIHIGPGKTGTSVIQNWSINNRTFLSENGIFYPVHNVDSNGVSGGHQLLLLSQKDSVWYFDKKKLDVFLDEVNTRRPKIVLLSSERFWLFIDDFKLAFPDAKFIFYVRSSIDYFESGYNQQVKRNNKIETIEGRFKHFTPLPYGVLKLKEAIDKYGRELFIIRLYDRTMFKHGNVLFDFFEIMCERSIPNISKEDINKSYCFEALEFKRLINSFDLDSWEIQKLDQLLQRYTDGNFNYTLLPEEIYCKFKFRVIKQMVPLLEEFGIEDDVKALFLKNLRSHRQKPILEQKLHKNVQLKLIKYIQENDERLAKVIECKVAINNKSKVI